ncbi:hypothetical protein [Kribbella sp. DT2]|uniref:hypothetical protein n=1 Tax=Kribbella sp. DT2 TaxID=3393427 RepID=UPI003CE8CFBF
MGWIRIVAVALASVVLAVALGACRGQQAVPEPNHDQAVSLHLPNPKDLETIFLIEDALEKTLDGSEAGSLDGNAIGPDDAVIHLYGPNADLLWSTIEPTLRTLENPPGSYVVKRYGAAGAREERVPMPQAIQR